MICTLSALTTRTHLLLLLDLLRLEANKHDRINTFVDENLSDVIQAQTFKDEAIVFFLFLLPPTFYPRSHGNRRPNEMHHYLSLIPVCPFYRGKVKLNLFESLRKTFIDKSPFQGKTDHEPPHPFCLLTPTHHLPPPSLHPTASSSLSAWIVEVARRLHHSLSSRLSWHRSSPCCPKDSFLIKRVWARL